MITPRVITLLFIALLIIQSSPLSQRDNGIYDDDSNETSVNISINDDDGDLDNFVLPVCMDLDQQIIFISRFYTECNILPGFPVCIYSDYFTDIITPPPDKTV